MSGKRFHGYALTYEDYMGKTIVESIISAVEPTIEISHAGSWLIMGDVLIRLDTSAEKAKSAYVVMTH